MGKIDEIKEILNSLRVAMSLVFGANILLIGSTVSRLEAEKFDVWTWVSICGIFALSLSLIVIFKLIAKRTKEIRDL